MDDITLKSKDPHGPQSSWIIHEICTFDIRVWYDPTLNVKNRQVGGAFYLIFFLSHTAIFESLPNVLNLYS